MQKMVTPATRMPVSVVVAYVALPQCSVIIFFAMFDSLSVFLFVLISTDSLLLYFSSQPLNQ